MMITEEEKARVMDRCVLVMPRVWTIADKCYRRLAVLGKGSWAVAFSGVQQQIVADGQAASKNSPQVHLVPETVDLMAERIAVKAIVKQVHSANSLKKYPRREVELMRRLTGHDHVVKLFAHWEDELCIYLAMELCSNRSLTSIIKSRNHSLVVASREMAQYVREILLGLQYIHRHMILHRDLKGDNVLLDADYHIKISDFGLSTTLSSHTELLHSICGTPKYQPPEMIRKTGYSFPADIWAVGCILYRLHYQIAPFDGYKSEEIYEKLLSQKIVYPRINRYHRLVCEDELRLMKCMLKKNPHKRGTIEQLLANHFLSEQSVNDIPVVNKLDHMMNCLTQIVDLNLTDCASQSPPLHHSVHNDPGLMPLYWIHQLIIDAYQPGLIFYSYNNSNLYGCTFPDQSRMLHINGHMVVYCSPDGTIYATLDDTQLELTKDLREKQATLLKKQNYLKNRKFSPPMVPM